MRGELGPVALGNAGRAGRRRHSGVIHLLNRRRTTVVDWGAMQFLELGRRARIKFRLSELLLLAGTDGLAGHRGPGPGTPVLDRQAAGRRALPRQERRLFGGQRRDVVLVIDGSGSMGRKAGAASATRAGARLGQAIYRQAASGRLGRRARRQRPGHAAGRAGQLRL